MNCSYKKNSNSVVIKEFTVPFLIFEQTKKIKKIRRNNKRKEEEEENGNWCAHIGGISYPFSSADDLRRRILETGYQSGEIYLTINRAGGRKKKKEAFSTRCSNEWNTSSFRTARALARGAYTRNTNIMRGYAGRGRGRGGLCELAAWYQRSTGNETAPDQEELICPLLSAYRESLLPIEQPCVALYVVGRLTNLSTSRRPFIDARLRSTFARRSSESISLFLFFFRVYVIDERVGKSGSEMSIEGRYEYGTKIWKRKRVFYLLVIVL